MSVGYIYKISSIGHDDVYFGSTVLKLDKRLQLHTISYGCWKRGTANFVSVYSLFDKYGVGNCIIEPVEEITFQDKGELTLREREFIKSTDCVNICFKNVKQEYSKTPVSYIQKYQAEYYQKRKRATQVSLGIK